MPSRSIAPLLAALLGVAALAAPAVKTPAKPAPAPAKPAASVRTFTNPVINWDFPDPFILRSGKTFYAFATNAGGANVQVASSSDLVNWMSGPDALPNIGSWATTGNTWAPEVLQAGKTFVMYYVAHDTESGRQCIGLATATKPAGPYVDGNAKPFVCQVALGGSIDPSPFTDTNGQHYLYWKSDGNCCGQLTSLFVSRLSPDGQALVGQPVELIHNTELWEGPLIEAPSVFKRAGKYYLMFSGSSFNSDLYAAGFAVGFSPLGPFGKVGNKEPFLQTNAEVAGPGGQGIITDDAGHPWIFYHAWDPANVGYPIGRRAMYISPISFPNGIPTVKPTVKPEPVPVVK